VAAAAVALGGGLLGEAPAATPTFTSATSAAATASSQTLTVPAPTGAAAGDVLLAAITSRLDAGSPVSAPTGWSDVVRTTCSSSSTALSQAIFVRVASPTEPVEYTFSTPSATGMTGAVHAYSGVDTTQPVAASAGAITRNSRGMTASITTTAPQLLLVGAFAHSGRSAIAALADMTSRTDSTTGASAPSARMLTADQLLGPAGTYTRSTQADTRNPCSVTQLVALRPGPDAPVSTSPPAIAGAPVQGQVLTSSPGSWTGSPTAYAYAWERCDAGGNGCGAVPDATDTTYVLTGADVGFTIRVVVTATNAGGSASAASATTTVVAPDPPLNVSPPTISGVAQDGELLTATEGTWSGSPTSFAYQWQRSGDGGQSWSDAPGTSPQYQPTGSDVGVQLRVVVTASNSGGSSSAASAPTDPVLPAAPPVNTAPPTITGTAQEGTTLTADEGAWTGSPSSYAYQWEACDQDGLVCGPIDGADSEQYTPGAALVGSRLRVTVTATNSGGAGTATSDLTAPVLVAAPVNVSPPAVSGIVLEGETLSATTGDWEGDPTSYEFLWQRCDENGESCNSVTWATESTYRLRPEDVGGTVRVEVTATNAGGPTAAVSGPTEVVIPLPPVNETPPTISGVFQDGGSATATPGTWLSSGPLTYAYQWQRSSDGAVTWDDVSGADGQSYELTGADVGTVVRAVVTASNAGGSSSAASDPSPVIAGPGGPVNVALPTFSGQLQPGRTLDADVGTWTGSPTSFGYQWQRSSDSGQSWSDISDATAVSYRLATDDADSEVRVVVTAFNDLGPGSAASRSAHVYPVGNVVALADLAWRCNTTVNLDLVKVTLWTRPADAVTFGNGCTGRIGRIEVDTWTFDALKTVNASTNAAHDLVVESGYAACHDRLPTNHQDGWQSMGGARITVGNFVWACGDMLDPFAQGVAQAVVIARAGAGATIPTDTVVEHSVLMPGAAHTFAIGESIRSGIRDSVVCPDRTGSTPFVDLGGAVDPIYEAIEEAPESDPRCSSFDAALAWAQS